MWISRKGRKYFLIVSNVCHKNDGHTDLRCRERLYKTREFDAQPRIKAYWLVFSDDPKTFLDFRSNTAQPEAMRNINELPSYTRWPLQSDLKQQEKIISLRYCETPTTATKLGNICLILISFSVFESRSN